MIEINLLPGARKAKRSRSATIDFGAIVGSIGAKIRDPYMIGAAGSVIVALLAVGGLWLYQQRSMNALVERRQQAVQDSTQYASLIDKRNAAEAQRDSVVRQVAIIKAIDGSRYVWPHILDEVSKALPPYTWLKSLNQTSAVSNLSPEIEAGIAAGEKKKTKLAAEADSAALAAGVLTFRIVGQTVDIQALTLFMKQLESSPWIERVQLTKTDLVMLQPGNKEATEFTLDMKLEKPDSAVIHRVPLTISGEVAVAIGPQNQRDQILTAIAIVALALAGAYWYFVYDPNTAKVDELAAHVDSLERSVQKAKAQLAKGSVQQILDEAKAFRENLDLMRRLVPAANEVSSLLEQVSTAARKSRFDIASFEPEPVIEGEMFDTYRYKIKVFGSYHEVAGVLTNIGSLNRIVAPIALTLGLPQGAAPKAQPGRQLLQATFEIQTYVVRTAPPKAKPKKDADKPAAAAGAAK